MSFSCCASSCQFIDTDVLSQSCGPSSAVFMGIISYLLSTQCDITEPCARMGKDGSLLEDNSEFDFVIVGAGAAGPVLASRLSENPDWNVLLLEAGPEEPSATYIPAFVTKTMGTALDWKYKTVPQENAFLSTDGVCSWSRGRMVSGTTGMNGNMNTRGHRSIYDGWEEEGNEGWGYDSLLQYFIKSENVSNPNVVDIDYHGFDGPLKVQQYHNHPELSDAILSAGIELGYPTIDVTGKNQTGFANALMTIDDNSLRATASRMYMEPHKDRENLHLAINSQVVKVLFNEDKNKATGVQFLDTDGNTKTIMATKEVILSAGAIGSPHILLLSGVGPKEDLNNLDIEVIQDIPVGENLHNHVATILRFYINDTAYNTFNLESFEEFLKTRGGPMASTGSTQTIGFVHSSVSEEEAPDLQMFFVAYGAGCSVTGLSSECSDGSVGNCGRRYVEVKPTNVLPRSRGYLKLNSIDPLDHPIINPKYLSEQHDIDVLLSGIKFALQIANTTVLQEWGFELDTTPVRGCEDLEFASDDYWICVIRTVTGGENHQAGSCKMGSTNDTSVIDSNLRVHGVDNLRVVDASIFPRMVNSNPTSTIIAVAERASDLIKATWSSK